MLADCNTKVQLPKDVKAEEQAVYPGEQHTLESNTFFELEERGGGGADEIILVFSIAISLFCWASNRIWSKNCTSRASKRNSQLLET